MSTTNRKGDVTGSVIGSESEWHKRIRLLRAPCNNPIEEPQSTEKVAAEKYPKDKNK